MAPTDIEAVREAVLRLYEQFQFSGEPGGQSAVVARRALVEELLEYLEARRVG